MGGMIAPIAGMYAAEDQSRAADNARRQALAQWTGLHAPDIASQQLNLSQYQNAGNLTPQQIQALQQGPSAMEGIQTDPRLAQAQMAALQQLSTTGQMGMTPAQQAALAQAQQNAASMGQAKNAQIMDQFARTGMGGSGAQLAAQLSASQGASQQLANNSNQVAQNAQQNALQAISQAGQLGGQIQGQQFGQKSQIAQAKDYINRFNTQNSQDVQRMNVAAANEAALRNLNNQQSIMGQNTQLQNQQQQYNKQLLQQQFNNQAALAAGRTGQYQGIAQAHQQNAANTADMYAGIGRGADTAMGSIYNAYNNSNNNDGSNFSDYGSAGQSGGNYAQGGYGNQTGGGYGSGQADEEYQSDLNDAASIYGAD